MPDTHAPGCAAWKSKQGGGLKVLWPPDCSCHVSLLKQQEAEIAALRQQVEQQSQLLREWEADWPDEAARRQQEAEIQRLNCSWEQTIRERNAIQELLTKAQEGWDAAHEAAMHYMNEPCTECRRLRALIEEEVRWLTSWRACRRFMEERAKVLEEKLR